MTPLTTTDPAAINNLARCFSSCVRGSSAAALKTYLITKTADIATPPCVTPTAPGTPTAFSTLDTILKISWTQPANPGSLILNYTIFYGTTAGGPYTNSKTVSVKQAILTGLTSGTTYYFVVVANSFTGCSSANSTEGSASTTGTPPICTTGLTFANAWASRVVANGGAAPSQATINAIANFQCGLITDGLDTSMIVWNAFVNDNLIAAITPQLKSATAGAGSTPTLDPWTNHNFVLADLTVNGLRGDGSTKYLDTGVQPQSPGAFDGTTDNVGLTAYISQVPTIDAAIAGCDNGSNGEDLLFGEGTLNAWSSAQQVGGANAGWTGYISGNAIPVHSGAFYVANSVTPHKTIGVVGALGAGATTVPPFKITVFCFNNNTGPLLFTNHRLSFFAVHYGLTSAKSALFFARIQTLRQALGGGFA